MPQSLTPASHLTRKVGVFYYRRVLPGGTRHQVAVSLKTRRFREAEHLAEVLDNTFTVAIGNVRLEHPEATPHDIAGIVRTYLRDELAKHITHEMTPGRGIPLAAWPIRELDGLIADRMRYLADRATNDIDHVIDRLARLHGLTSNDHHALGIGIREADIEVLRQASKYARGELPLVVMAPTEQPLETAPAPPPLVTPPPAPPTMKPLASTLVDGHFVRRANIANTTHQVMGQERATLSRFIEAAGDKPIDGYGRGDITGFLDTLRRLPPNYGRSPALKGRTLADIIAEADASSTSIKRLTDKTAKRHLSALSGFFQTAVDLGHLTASSRIDMLATHGFKRSAQARTQRDMWTSDDLTKLFLSPVWTGRDTRSASRPGALIVRDAKFWLPLLALFHGARLEEFADLYRRDMFLEDGVWFINIQETAADEATGTRARRLKTGNSTRVIPLHPELVRIGFPDYVKAKAPQTNDPLFPDLEPQGMDQKRGPRFTRTFGYYRQQVEVYRPGVGMHAFRHTANTRLRDAITDAQQERHIEFMMGHASGGGEGRERYDKGPARKAMAATLSLLTFPEIDLTHLYVAVPQDEVDPQS